MAKWDQGTHFEMLCKLFCSILALCGMGAVFGLHAYIVVPCRFAQIYMGLWETRGKSSPVSSTKRRKKKTRRNMKYKNKTMQKPSPFWYSSPVIVLQMIQPLQPMKIESTLELSARRLPISSDSRTVAQEQL
uniref:Palmitoyltransferase n=1 Tax=Steinernema glaseri TaxID=37863 RepID=A0A1I7ZC72_9BILA